MRTIRIVTIFIAVFILFRFLKFIKSQITNFDLPRGKILFTSSIRGNDEIYTMSLNGIGLRRLTKYSIFGATFDTVKGDGAASFSPDAKSIVSLSDRDDKGPRRKITHYSGGLVGEKSLPTFQEIYIMNSDGSNQTRLTYNQVNNSAPVFSPDGKRILFSTVPSTKIPFYEQIRLINPDGTGERTIARGRLISRLVKFSTDSRKVFFVDRGDLYTIDINTGNLTRLTYFNFQNIEKPDDMEGLPYIDNFAISSDDKEITFATKERKALQFIFYSMNVDGSKMKELARLDNPDQRGYIGWIRGLKYMPGGQRVVFIGDFFTDQAFYLLDKNNNLNFIRNFNIKIDIESDFIFTPDGNRVLFVAELPYGLFDDWFVWLKSTAYEIYGNLKYFIFRRISGPYDNKYLCVMDIDGRNLRKIAKLPVGSEFGRDFIHWE